MSSYTKIKELVDIKLKNFRNHSDDEFLNALDKVLFENPELQIAWTKELEEQADKILNKVAQIRPLHGLKDLN